MLIKVTETTILGSDEVLGSAFVDPSILHCIRHGGGDRRHRTVLGGEKLSMLVAESPEEVKALIDLALAAEAGPAEAAPVAEEE